MVRRGRKSEALCKGEGKAEERCEGSDAGRANSGQSFDILRLMCE